MGAGLFADAHRAIGDCQALLQILSSPFGAEGKPALATLLANARETTIRIFAVDSPFDRKNLLKARGYRWSNGTNGCVVAGGETSPSATSKPNSRSCAPTSTCGGRFADAVPHRPRALLDEHTGLTGRRPQRPTHPIAIGAARASVSPRRSARYD